LLKFGELPVGFDHSDVYDWLDDCLHTPLNDSALTLSSLKFESTLREAEFYFPMENVQLAHLQQLLGQYRSSLQIPDQQLAKINHQLPGFGQLKGMMHGFIDLIFEADGKYYLCDYKSSHLGDRFSDYLPADLASHVVENFYDLQFLIYSLALHRYLARRIKNYDVNQHFGGVYYLYLRGMSAANDDFNGVFFQALSQTLLEDLDNVFRGITQINKEPRLSPEKLTKGGSNE
jgi:exodeoxyribonuclease V beta subunit